MMAGSNHFEIGKRNNLALKKIFWKLGIFVDREDVGGIESRSVRLDLETGRIDLRRGSAPGEILVPPSLVQMTRMTEMAHVTPVLSIKAPIKEGGAGAHSRR
jgi:hypothetical protein